MSAEEALQYGLIDEIVQPNDNKIKSLQMPPENKLLPNIAALVPKNDQAYKFGKLVT